MKIDTSVESRYREKWEEDPNGCWIWQSTTQASGHGQLWVDGRHRGAHRVSYKIHKGEIPDGMHICHKCDVNPCVNPDHLYAGSRSDNVQDAIERTGWIESRERGEEHHSSKLTWDEVGEIRSRYANTEASQYDLASEYGVSASTVGEIVRREIWTERESV